jgi:hypothetical protein
MSVEHQEWDLASLSRRNYQMHPYRRGLALAIGAAVVVGFLTLASLVLRYGLAHPAALGAGYVVSAVCLIFAYLGFAPFWWLFRAWAAPPVRIGVDVEGVELLLLNGKSMKLAWSDDIARLDLVVRTTDSQVDPSARVWLVAAIKPRAIQAVWLPVVPDCFLPEESVAPILQLARSAGASVQEMTYWPGFPRDSSRSWIMYRVSASGSRARAYNVRMGAG